MADLSPETLQKIVKLLMPLMRTPPECQALLTLAFGSSSPIFERINLSGAPAVYIPNLVRELAVFGKDKSGKQALWALLEVVHDQVGVDKQKTISELRQEIDALSFLIKKQVQPKPTPRPKQLETKPEIFISYSWEDDGLQVTEALDDFFQGKGITIVRDSRDIGYKGLINDYMKRLGSGKYVVVVLSDAYFKSKDCMYELMLLADHKDFYDRIFPVTVESTSISNAEHMLTYANFWDEKISHLQAKIREMKNLANLEGIQDDLNLYVKIRQQINSLLNFLRNINTRSLHNNNFELLYQAIHAKIADDPLEKKRRVDAAVPGNAEVGHTIDLLIQVRFSDSPLLGIKDWPIKQKPSSIEQRSDSIALKFPADQQTGKLCSAYLKIRVIASDFAIEGENEKIVEVPPNEYSKLIGFLLSPKKSGACRINVEVYTTDYIYLGNVPLETVIGGIDIPPTTLTANLWLLVAVAGLKGISEAVTPSNKIIESKPQLVSPEDKAHDYVRSMKPIPPNDPQFYMASYLVSNDLYYHFICANKDWRPIKENFNDLYLKHWIHGKPLDEDRSLPITHVSIEAAKAFSDWLSKLTDCHVRLPKYEEWEMAMLAGRSKSQCLSEEIRKKRVNYKGTSVIMHAVNDFAPNPFGIRDLLGNAYDLCVASDESESEILRAGGCYFSTKDQLMKPLRVKFDEACRRDTSFRCVRET